MCARKDKTYGKKKREKKSEERRKRNTENLQEKAAHISTTDHVNIRSSELYSPVHCHSSISRKGEKVKKKKKNVREQK